MSLLTTHFSRAYSPRVAFNSVTGFDSPAYLANRPQNVLTFAVFLLVYGLSELWMGRAGSLKARRSPSCRSVNPHDSSTLFDGGVVEKIDLLGAFVMATLSLRDRASKLNPLLSSCGKADTLNQATGGEV